MKIYRQGDVNLVPVKALPAGAEKVKPDNGRVILAYGEVTGHAHALPVKAATQYKVGSSGKEYVQIKTPTALTHEEHAPVNLEPGLYEKRMAREYTPQGIRQVID